MMPLTEPNARPPRFDTWEDWREAYAERVAEFNRSAKTGSDELYLRMKLGHLNFAGLNLDNEVTYIKEGGT